MTHCYVWTVQALATVNICLQMWRTSYILNKFPIASRLHGESFLNFGQECILFFLNPNPSGHRISRGVIGLEIWNPD